MLGRISIWVLIYWIHLRMKSEFVTDLGLIVTLSISCIPAARMLLLEHLNSEQGIETCNNILKDFDRALLKVCVGQVKDLTEQEPTLEKCWEIAVKRQGRSLH
jgi:hypothetical protein